MKILMDETDLLLLQEIADHIGAKLDNPAFLYEIEDPRLATCAIALGGIRFMELPKPMAPAVLAIMEPEPEPETVSVETVEAEPEPEIVSVETVEAIAAPTVGRDLDIEPTVPMAFPDNGKSKGFSVSHPVKTCEICGKAFSGHPRADVCSGVCRKEKNRRYAAEYQAQKRAGKLEAGTKTETPL